MSKNSLKYGRGYNVFYVWNIIFLCSTALLCILPMVNVLAISFSKASYVTAGLVKFWPVGFTVASYVKAFSDTMFYSTFLRSIIRVVLGTGLGLFFCIITAYPLSRNSNHFPQRKYYVWYYFFTSLFSGGLIATFLIVYYTHLYNTIWALIVPGLGSVWNSILLLNFFRSQPKELEEAAIMDGAGHLILLFRILVPISAPCIATCALFSIVGHWNDWFGPLIYMATPKKWTLQTYLQSLMDFDTGKLAMRNAPGGDLVNFNDLSTKTLRAAMVFVAMVPILIVYPFLQKHFTQGLVLGSVKG